MNELVQDNKDLELNFHGIMIGLLNLSDSVIYMAYYTLSRFVNDGTVQPENLTKEFFDYVLLDKGDVELVASTSKLSEDTINTMKKEFHIFLSS